MTEATTFYFVNRKRNAFFLFCISPLLMLILWSVLIKSSFTADFFQVSGAQANRVYWGIIFLQFLLIVLMKKTVVLFDLKTKVQFFEDHFTIQSEPTFFYKRRNNLILNGSLHYFQITQYVRYSTSKNLEGISFNLSYDNSQWDVYITPLRPNEKNFVNFLMGCLKEVSQAGVNDRFYFKNHWTTQQWFRKAFWVVIVGALLFFMVALFTMEKKILAFSPLFGIGVLLTIYAQGRELTNLNAKILQQDPPWI